MTNMNVEVTEDEAAHIRDGLTMRANFIETGNLILSLADATDRKMMVRPLTDDQIDLANLLRRLSERFCRKV